MSGKGQIGKRKKSRRGKLDKTKIEEKTRGKGDEINGEKGGNR